MSDLVYSFLVPVVVILWVSAAMIMAITVIDAFLERIMVDDVEELASPSEADRRSRATTVFALRRLTVAVAVLLGAGITLTTANVFQTLGFSLIAGAGGLTLLLGFAAREVLANLLASFQISANRSAREVKLLVAPSTDVSGLRAFYEDWMKGDARVGGPDSYQCYVIDQNEFGMTGRLNALVPDPRDGWDVECELREAVIHYLASQQQAALQHLGSDAGKMGDDVPDTDATD